MKFHIKEYPELLQTVEAMPVEELLKCVVCPHVDTKEPVSAGHTYVASFLFTSEQENHAKCIRSINEGRTTPSLFTGDMEAGAAGAFREATPFPAFQALAVGGDEQAAYELGAVCAAEALQDGIHWSFAPCVDITGNHNNPIVSFRCSGDSTEANIRFGGAYMRGMQDNGVIATPKHFPGDGYDTNDQHLTVGVNPLDMPQWRESFGRVYRELIEQGAKSIMAGHIALPAYDPLDEELGYAPPATLSKKLLTDLLRGELGFDGIIISDAATMGGFAGCMNLYRACARFLECGGDCLLFLHVDEEFVREVEKWMERGELSLATLRNRAYRMLCFARQYWEETASLRPAYDYTKEKALALSEAITDRACVIVRDRNNQLPLTLSKQAKILHVVLDDETYPANAAAALTEALRECYDSVEELHDPGPWQLSDLARSGAYDQIICSVGSTLSYGTNSCRLTGPMARNMMEGWMRYQTPVVFVNFGHPYFHEDYLCSVDTVINTYGYTPSTAKYVMQRLTQPS